MEIEGRPTAELLTAATVQVQGSAIWPGLMKKCRNRLIAALSLVSQKQTLRK